jgi:hypothetical protein
VTVRGENPWPSPGNPGDRLRGLLVAAGWEIAVAVDRNSQTDPYREARRKPKPDAVSLKSSGTLPITLPMMGLRERSPRRWVKILASALVVGGVPTGLGVGVASAGTSSCGTSANLVPTCGILWGAHASSGAAALEQAIGRNLAIVHDYTQWSSTFPTASEESEAAQGSILFIDWTARDYTTNAPAATWSQIASGAEDDQINSEASALKAFGQPLMLTFQAEPEQRANSVYGTYSDYVGAWRHIHDVFAADGVKNVVWVWDVEGDTADHNYSEWYPGDSYVDWIMWDPYNWYGCNGGTATWRSFSQIVSPMYSWLTHNSGTAGNGDYLSKPWGLGEFGSVEGPSSTSKEQWFEDAITSAQQDFPQLKALVYFDSTDTTNHRSCPWVVNSSAESLAGYTAAGASSYASAMYSASGGPTTTTTMSTPSTTLTTLTTPTTSTTTTTTTLPSRGGTAPTITEDPASKSVVVGTRVTFRTAPSGSPASSVVWQLSENGGTTWYWLRQHTSPNHRIFAGTATENASEVQTV